MTPRKLIGNAARVVPGGPRSGTGRETRLSCFSQSHPKVWIPFPALRAAGDDIEEADRQ
jgi:hypothetical protein